MAEMWVVKQGHKRQDDRLIPSIFSQVITQGGVTYRNEPWHRECFTCTNCQKSLAGQRFVFMICTFPTVVTLPGLFKIIEYISWKFV